jgi:hypothetical protein
MPQLDKLTFYSQAVTCVILFILLFVTLISVVLPIIFRVQRIRFLYKKKQIAVNSANIDKAFINSFKTLDFFYFSMCDEFIFAFKKFEFALKDSYIDDDRQEIIDNIRVLILQHIFETNLSQELSFDEHLTNEKNY